MRHNRALILTPTILAVMEKVSADEIYTVLRNNFLGVFSKSKPKALAETDSQTISGEGLKLLETIRNLAKSSEPVNTVKLTREVRE